MTGNDYIETLSDPSLYSKLYRLNADCDWIEYTNFNYALSDPSVQNVLMDPCFDRLTSVIKTYADVYAIATTANASIAQLNSSVYALNSSVDVISRTSGAVSSQQIQNIYSDIHQVSSLLDETKRSVSTNEKTCASLNAYYNDLLNRVSVLESKLGITNSSINSSTSSSTNTSTAESSTNSSTNSSTSSSDYLASYK